MVLNNSFSTLDFGSMSLRLEFYKINTMVNIFTLIKFLIYLCYYRFKNFLENHSKVKLIFFNISFKKLVLLIIYSNFIWNVILVICLLIKDFVLVYENFKGKYFNSYYCSYYSV